MRLAVLAPLMAKKASGAIGGTSSASPQSEKPAERSGRRGTPPSEARQKPSALLDTRVIYYGDNLEQLAKLPDACMDLIYIDSPKAMQKAEGRMMIPARFPILHSSFRLLPLPVTGSFYYHCDWHASHYVKVMLDQKLILLQNK
jgi:hypothetical protein